LDMVQNDETPPGSKVGKAETANVESPSNGLGILLARTFR